MSAGTEYDVDDLQQALSDIVAPDAPFWNAADHEHRHDPGLMAVAHAAVHLWGWLASGFASVLLAEVAKGAAGELGKTMAERATAWAAGPPPEPAKDVDLRARLAETDLFLEEAITRLDAAAVQAALDGGEAAVRAQLEKKDFPERRAKRLAKSLRDVAQKRHGH